MQARTQTQSSLDAGLPQPSPTTSCEDRARRFNAARMIYYSKPRTWFIPLLWRRTPGCWAWPYHKAGPIWNSLSTITKPPITSFPVEDDRISVYERIPLELEGISRPQSTHPQYTGRPFPPFIMRRGLRLAVGPNNTYRSLPDADGDSQSSSSNSPARADFEESDFYVGNNDSQSSIGVPTFQDMAVSEELKIAPANRLPAEVLIGIFSKLSSPQDLLNCMCVSKRWARNSVDLLWHRPACTSWPKHSSICTTLSLPDPYFAYRDFIKRLNLASLAERVNDGSVVPLAVCTRVERLTLTNCEGLTDGGLTALLTGSNHLLALDISGDTQITEDSMFVLAEHCRRLQGLNISSCTKISNESMIKVAENCRYIKRVSFTSPSLLRQLLHLLTILSWNWTIVISSKMMQSSHLPMVARTSSKLTFINVVK